MNFSCVAEFNYFDTPEYLSLLMHIVTIVSIPIHCLGLYCIIYKTPERMKTVKWYLFALHSWIVVFDYSLSLLTVPFLLIPKGAGYPLGVSQYTDVPLVYQTIIMMSLFAYMVISIVSIFENRFFNICTFSFKHHWVFLRRLWLAAHYIIVVLFMIPMVFLVPEQTIAVQHTFEQLPCLPNYIYNAPVFVLSEDITYHFIISVIFVVLCCIEISVFVGYLASNSLEQLKQKRMSPKTFQLQKKFFIVLVIQMSIPLICFLFPLISAALSVLLNYYNQGMINTGLIIASWHGIVSTISMLILHRPYRRAVKALFYKSEMSNQVEVSQSRFTNLRSSKTSIAVVTV
ncbi:Serpentine Receptor, class H [Caenorhabditis elegans]|uniref:Serpentine Receptor, class H n=1 Tax=Caenorhabditis elegans TaxID=6239 RepID=Q22989_CAEEL|nr:Serpentine Receptor, class H [Caenorhabditis elegans]CCD71397.1 Serpentine Receptor, class H [Caenorhabditis elegans]|eukprot:NP_504183.2 Serpentine Receptor, class H [Caenorhabditis elegans]